jgi:predicted aspartyl protease
MKSLAAGLPKDIARQIHPSWRKNEAGYWAVRDQLLGQYRNQWIGFSDGVVVASGTRPVVVFHAAHQVAEHPYVICVGRENEPFRIRRVNFAYDASYPAEPLPVIRAEFRRASGGSGLVLDQIIPDTGADTSTLPWTDCQQLQLNPSDGVPALMSGVAGGSVSTLGFLVWVHLDGNEYQCQLHADFIGNERILGRDVLNSLEVLFRGPSGEVVINP